MGISLILLMIPRTMTFVLFLTALFGLGMALLIPMLATMVSRRSVTGAGAGLGMQNAVNSLGQAIGPVAGGLLFTLSIHLPYLLAGILLLVSTGLLRISVFDKAIEMKD
jgi:MFS transporter, DHA1 family, multidrug resistance protein